MKIALAQMKVVAGGMGRNLKTMLKFVEQAKEQAVDLIAFPEMCTQGYLVGDAWLNNEFCRISESMARTLREASDGIAIAWGSLYLDEDIEERLGTVGGHYPNKDGRKPRRYNAVHVVQNKQAVKRLNPTQCLPEGIVPKALLPNYRMFDDQRYFFSLNDLAADFGVPIESLVQPLIIKDRNGEDVPILFETCEDMWAEDYRSKGESLNVTKMGIENGAELVINLSASPWTYGKNSARDRRVRFLAGESSSNNKPFLYVNCMGVQNNGKNFVTFDGGSTVYNREGHLVQLAEEAYQESLMIVDTDKLDQLTPIERCPRSAIAEKYDAIVAGIQSLQDIVNAPNRPKFVIGLSGGVDSAVVAALLVKAVGHENVVGINMPTQWNSQATQDAASSLAEALKIDYYPVPISEMVTSVESALKGYYLDQRGLSLSSLTEENIQAKTRGTSVLSNIAGNDGRFFTNNGNKLEIALGYATLYGDVGGAIAPIGDLLKSEVFEMARYLNREVFDHEVIPESLIPDELYRFSDEQIQPSAELKEQQVDPMKFGYHDAVLALATDYQKWGEEKIVAAFKEGTLHYAIAERLGKESNYGLQLMQRWGVDKADHFLEDITLFFVKMQGSVFKRVQAPGIVITSKSAFGFDIRESMIPYYETDALIKMREALQGTVYQPNEPSA